MEDYKTLIESAYREAKVADYMIYVTSKLVRDKKVLISVLMHLDKSFNNAITAYLTRERMFRRVPPVPSDSQLLVELFFEKCAQNLKVEKELKNVMIKINKAIKAYIGRGMLLERTNKYVFIAPNYELIDLRPNEVKEWIKKNIEFVNLLREDLNR